MPATMIHLLRVRGVAVRFDVGWLLVFSLVVWTLAIGYFPRVLPDVGTVALWIHATLAASLLFGSVLIHEIAHTVVARAWGVRVLAITLHVFGGVSELEDEPPSPAAEFAIALAGPVTSFVLALIAYAVATPASDGSAAAALLSYVAMVNVLVGGFNLVPAFPLDGGRALRAVLWAWKGRMDRATRMASRLGAALAMLLSAVGGVRAFGGDIVGGLWLVLIGLYLYQAAHTSEELSRLRTRLERLRVADVMTAPPDVALAAGASARGAPALRPDDSAWTAFLRLARAREGTLAVVDAGALVGVLDRRRLEQVLSRSTSGGDLERAA